MQKKAMKMSILLMIFFTITLSNLGPIGLSVAILAITYQLVLGAFALEDKNSSDIILVSLPMKKRTIVLSKYVSIYVYSAYAIIGYTFIYLMVNLFHLPLEVPLTLIGVIGSIVGVTLYFSISFPLIFKYGYIKSKMANLVVFLGLVFGGTLLIYQRSQNDPSIFGQQMMGLLQEGSNLFIMMGLFVILAIIFMLSYFISLTLYEKREF